MTNYIGGAYDKCLHCPYLGNGCDGPNTNAMTLERLHEWWRELKRIRGYSNALIADRSGLSERTIASIMGGKTIRDLSFSTVSALNLALVGSGGQWPCALVVEKEMPEATKELAALQESYAEYRKDTQSKLKHLNEEVEHMRSEAKTKSKLLEKLISEK